MISDEVDKAIDRTREQGYNPQDLAIIYEYLIHPDNDLDRLYSAVYQYLDNASPVDWDVAITYINFPADPSISSAAIMAASLRGCTDERFWQMVVEIALGVDWDVDNIARVQAILALHLMPAGSSEARRIIQHSLLSDWETVRDSAAIAAQRCSGRREPEVVTDRISGRLIESVGSDVLNWIWPEREES